MLINCVDQTIFIVNQRRSSKPNSSKPHKRISHLKDNSFKKTQAKQIKSRNKSLQVCNKNKTCFVFFNNQQKSNNNNKVVVLFFYVFSFVSNFNPSRNFFSVFSSKYDFLAEINKVNSVMM